MTKELTNFTIDVCEKIDVFKKNIKDDMVIGDTEIISGAILFKEVIMEINPSDLTTDLFELIQKGVTTCTERHSKKNGHVTNYMRYGINHCFNILESTAKFSKKRIKNKLYANLLN